ncbi:TPA: restriction endonuclease subunit S [Escherichia coli]|uniref:restriction endonuclease subunit S n=1 Tax=Escherichia coli TaxID=562 RepID=UPI001B0B63E6|nr:restriction endonuclease subunit S [Escherichia coli]HAW1350807.1 restriction endonuclease subunit S [Escherichia coli]HAW3182702.1 restriction endonuclease subunit S [Escherichia coli]HBA4092188.1 restriction endonuclease subunit S [Escherichia coli]HEB5671394.1 restriction endonuclease subunit S [Escherichia coli]
MVPKGWEIKHLSELASKISDGIHKTPLYADTSEIYFINGNNLKSGSIVIQDSTKCVDENDAINHRKDLGVRTLLMSINGTIGNLAYYRGENVVLGKSASYINIKDSVNLDFIYYVLSSSKTQAFYESELTGTTIRNLSIKSIKSTEILTPPLPEQKKIAQILSTWDKAISVTEKLLTNSQQQKKALMQQLLTGKKRLLDENGVRFSGEWEKGKFCDMANIDTGYAFKSKDFTQSDSGIPIIRMSDFKTGGLDVLGAAKVDRDSVNGLDKFKLRVGDFVFGMSGSLNNYGRVEKKDLPCYLNQRVGRILAKECANQAFITYLYLSDSIQQSILDKAAGAAQLNISISDLRSMVVYYPCIEEQQKIAAVLSAADAEISTLEKKLACLRDEKKALMQQLLTGKRRVKVDEAVAE